LGLSNIQLSEILEENYDKYNRLQFIEGDPISIPHQFSLLQDIEISGLLVSILAWGQRKTIIAKGRELLSFFDYAPYDFMLNHSEEDLKRLMQFKHRTFNSTDLLYFIHFFKKYYESHHSLESIFNPGEVALNTGPGIQRFYNYFVDDNFFLARTGKHVASPGKKSACKRINMYLRWMVRTDDRGVDFGLWKSIRRNQLVCPCDVHVEKVARQLGLITRKQLDWQTAEELTENLKIFDKDDPVRFDFALFGMGLNQK
jgi:uncharacterized protein (TIGR02757 family)